MGDRQRSTRLVAWLLALLVALNAAILILRIVSVLRYGRLVLIPIEGPGIYAIWRILHGVALYEWPDRDFFSLTLYNFLFYHLYARVLGFAGIDGGWIPVAARFITVTLALAGMAIQYRLTRYIAGTGIDTRGRVMLAAMAFITWFGCGLTGWWALAIRADIAATVFSTAALFVCVVADRRRDRRLLVAAGALFFLTWACKQSQFAALAGAAAYFLVWRRSLRDVAALMVPVVAGVGLALAAGGEVYRSNIIEAPQVGTFIPWMAVHGYRSVLLPQLLIWGLPLVLPFVVHVGGRRPIDSLGDLIRFPSRLAAMLGKPVEPLVFAGTASLLFGFLALAKAGSEVNHLLELNVCASVLCAVALTASLPEPASRRRDAFAAMFLVPMVLFAGALLLGERGSPAADRLRLHARALWPVTLPQGEYERRVTLVREIASLPKPLFIDDEVLGQPWFATNGAHPTIVLDRVYYDQASSRGRLIGGIEDVIRRRHFAAIVITTPPWTLQRAAVEAGYVKSGRVSDGRDTWQVLVRNDVAGGSQQSADQPQYAVPKRRPVR